MPHIHNQPGQVDFTVTMFLFRKRDGVLETMLHMHRKLGKLMPVGGHVELDETPWQAVAHELEEESGYELSRVKLLQPTLRIKADDKGMIVHPQPMTVNTVPVSSEHFHSDLSYAFVVDGAPTKPIDERESSDIRWLTWEQIDALAPDEMYENARSMLRFVMSHFAEWELVDPLEYSLRMPEEV